MQIDLDPKRSKLFSFSFPTLFSYYAPLEIHHMTPFHLMYLSHLTLPCRCNRNAVKTNNRVWKGTFN